MTGVFAHPAVWLVGACLCVVLLSRPASAQSFLGPNECTDCHDHKDELEWSRKLDGDGRSKQHFNARNQLRDVRAAEWAKAIGLDNVFDIGGTCVKCHATVVRGKDRFGITCESCHGPGSDYLEPHKEKEVGYQKAIKLGMKDVRGKPGEWAKDCLTCHVLGDNPTDAALAKAGHPDGSDFNLAVKFRPVALHWTPPKNKYTENQVSAPAGPVYTGLLAKLKAAVAKLGGGATVEKPSVDKPPVEEKPPVDKPPVEKPTVGPPGEKPAAEKPPVAGPSVEKGPARKTERVAPTGVGPPPVQNPGTGVPIAPVPLPEPALPRSPTGIVAAIQGRLASILDALLSKGVTTPIPPPPPANTYRGADADLLRLQQEAIALALEALGTKPPETAKPKQ
jgi:hypothetical protein